MTKPINKSLNSSEPKLMYIANESEAPESLKTKVTTTGIKASMQSS